MKVKSKKSTKKAEAQIKNKPSKLIEKDGKVLVQVSVKNG